MNDVVQAGAPGSIVSQMTEQKWNRLLESLGKKQLIPVIGPELLRIKHDGTSALLYDLWGETLARRRGIEISRNGDDTPLLYKVTNKLSVDPDMPINEFGSEIDAVVNDPSFPVPVPLQQLAGITDFPLYLATTIDHLLEKALIEARGDRDSPRVIAFKPGGGEIDCDLPDGFSLGSRAILFQLFGRTGYSQKEFAATEDALIEFSWALIDHEYSPKHLYDYLRDRTLLLLGCNFPDWLDRFFIHAITRERGIDVQFVSEYRTSGLVDFLKRKRAPPAITQSPVEFVDELYRRWNARHEAPAQTAHAGGEQHGKYGSVFISYAREDKTAAKDIRAQLERMGIDTWMDESDLEPGDDFKEIIHDNIRSSALFLAVISKTLDPEGSGPSRHFVFREWRWALDVATELPCSVKFLLPVIIDGTSPTARFIDEEFRKHNCTVLDKGKLPKAFLDSVKKSIRNFRKLPAGVKS